MEDVLVPINIALNEKSRVGLNPCCGGRCSSTYQRKELRKVKECLNPCCGGRCSSTNIIAFLEKFKKVLILVVVEDVLVQTKTNLFTNTQKS